MEYKTFVFPNFIRKHEPEVFESQSTTSKETNKKVFLKTIVKEAKDKKNY